MRVTDTTPPVVKSNPPIVLWPPDHQYLSVSLSQCVASVTDACDGTLAVSSSNSTIVSVTSDEPEEENGGGSGNTCSDMLITNATTVSLRSERNGTGTGRVYTIHYIVKDQAGNAQSAICRSRCRKTRGRRSPLMCRFGAWGLRNPTAAACPATTLPLARNF